MRTTVKTIWDLLYLVGHHRGQVRSCDPEFQEVEVSMPVRGGDVRVKFEFDPQGQYLNHELGALEFSTMKTERRRLLADSNAWKDLEHRLDSDSLKSFHADSEASLRELEDLIATIQVEDSKND